MKKELVKVCNLNVVYDLDYYGNSGTVRDLITSVRPSSFFKSKERKKLHLLKDINLSVKEGEIVGILGVNGSGKTTLCRYIAGLDGGENLCLGTLKSVFSTVIGVMPELTGRENAEILIELMYPQFSKNIKKDILESSIAFAEIGNFIDVPFKTYSKGMKARLFLSIVSERESDVLILDEVFDGADVFFNKKITKRVKKMIQNSGCVLFVSHEKEKLIDVCNRGIVINNSEIAFDGSIVEAIKWYEEKCDPR